MNKLGVLCFGDFERGKSIYWEVRRDGWEWVIYREDDEGVKLMGRYGAVKEAWEEFTQHIGE